MMLMRWLLTATLLIAAPALAQTSAPSESSRRTSTVAAVIDACQAVWPSAAEPQQARPTDLRSARREVRQACAADLRSFCDGKRGRERGDCLRDNQEKFSSSCQDAMRNVRSARQAQRRGGSQQDEDDEF